ncbi:MAG: CvpA family protein [Phycisphaerales bacterium]|nr:CvpA family protein [Phycisphaerales bacterium]
MTALAAENYTIRGRVRPRTPGFVWSFRTCLFASLTVIIIFGSPIARGAAVATAAGAVWGDFSGGIRTLFRLFGFLIAIWLAPRLSGAFAGPIAGQTGWHPVVCSYAGMAIAAVGVLSIASIITWATARALRARPFTHGADRVFGGVLGGAAGAASVVVLSWLALTFEQPAHDFFSRADRLPASQRMSMLDGLSRMHDFIMNDPLGKTLADANPLPRIPMVATAGNLAKLAGNAKATQALLDDPRFRSLFEQPEVRRHLDAIRQDDSLRGAFVRKDLGAIMVSKPFQDMLLDDELHKVMTLRWAEIQAAMAQHADD